MPRCRRWVTISRKGYCRCSSRSTRSVASREPSLTTMTSKEKPAGPRAWAQRWMNSGRLSASSFAGTSTLTSSVLDRGNGHTRFRIRAGRIPSWSRYLATVRRAIWIPCSWKRWTIC